jgi:hypothetical protein
MGSTIKGFNVANPAFLMNSNQLLNVRQLNITAYYLPVAATITGVRWFQFTQATGFTANNYNGVCLYTYSAGTLTLVASSTNDGTIWSTFANQTWGNKAFSSTYSAAAGLYFVGAIESSSAATTYPYLGGTIMQNANWALADFTNGAKVSSIAFAQTSLPTTISFSSFNPTTMAWGLYLY